MLALIERFLDRSPVRLLLASLIVFSVLLPHAESRPYDPFFFAIFGTELALRVFILRKAQRLSRAELVVLLTDAVALISFLTFVPHFETLVGTRVLRLIRLARLVFLVRFLRTVVADLRGILAQRQIRYQLGFLVAAVALLTFVGGIVLSTLEVPVDDFDGDGRADSEPAAQVLWWTFRQIEDPGNLVENAEGGVLLLVVSLVLTVAGVFVMSFIIGIGTSVVGALMAAGRRRPVLHRDHTVVIGGGSNVREVLEDLVQMYAKNRRKVRIAVLDEAEEPPRYLEEPLFRGVEYRAGEPTSIDAHRLLGTAHAKRIIVLNDEERGEESDAYAVSSVLALREENESALVVVEMRHRRYMSATRVAGGGNVNPIPMGQFLGSLVSHNIMFPGVDVVFEELLTARGSEVYSHIYDSGEMGALNECVEGRVPFLDILLDSYREHGVITIGVFLGDGEWTDDVGRLVVWLNPLDEPPEAAAALGATRGEVPLCHLRGLIAVAPEYSANRRAAVRLLEVGEATPPATADESPRLEAILVPEMVELERVLVLGDNELMPAMCENTAEFVAGVEFLVVPARSRLGQVRDELRRRTGKPVAAEGGGETYPLARGGSVTVVPSVGDMLADALEHPLVVSKPVDAVVLLADPTEADPDANSALMLLRLLECVGDGCIDVGPRFRMIIEALSGPKGARLEARLSRELGNAVRVVPTRQMRSYFLVDAAYMPGSERAHLELLSPHEQDFCQLRLVDPSGEDREMAFEELLSALARGDPPVIAFGVTLRGRDEDGGLVLNPNPGDKRVRFRPSGVEVVYAVGETERIGRIATSENEEG